jgi:HEAT repeat protein
LAGLLASSHPSVRSNAAMLLGWMGDRSAIGLLKEIGLSRMPRQISRERESITRLQVTEAIVALGDEEMIDPLRAAAYSDAYEVRILAIQTLGRLGDRKMEQAFLDAMNRKEEPIELRMGAAEALARMGTPAVVLEVLRHVEMVLKASADANPLVRAQAAHTLGLMEHARRAGLSQIESSGGTAKHPAQVVALFESGGITARLTTMLDDDDEQVRLSAAAALLRVES